MLISVPSSNRFSAFRARTLPAWTAFQPGDHVSVSRGLYTHHAVYVGNGWLIEFGSGLFGGVIAHVAWEDFAGNAQVKLERRAGWSAVQRAESQLGRNDFDLVSRNCEHFANWCATGRWESKQVETVIRGLGVAAGACAVTLVLKGMARIR